MVKKISLFLFVLSFVPSIVMAEWVPVDNNKTSTPPEVSILSDNSNSTVIKIDLSGFELRQLNSNGKTYQTLDLLNDIFTTEAGSPQLPYISKVLAIPDNASVSVEVLEVGAVQIFKNIDLAPARPSWQEGTPEPTYEKNNDSYISTGVYPQEYVSVESPSVFRDFRIARVSVYPLRYIPAKKELEVVSSITVRINYGTGEVVNPKTSAKRAIPPSFAKLYRSFIFNYESVLDQLYGGKEEGHEVMLCIMPDEFTESFQVYADWKRESGTDIHITTFSDIGANANNPDIVKDHISDAYYDWEIPPSYVLIVGDNGVFPKKTISYPDYSFPNEDYFVEVEGDDFFPEMMIGRFTNQGDYRMQVMINKMMMYEKTPYVEETDWFTQGTFCSNNDYESQVKTKRFAADRVLEYGFTSVDTMMSDGNGWGNGCTYDVYDIMDVLNEGRSYLNYRGEGWNYGWYANCYDFHTDNVSNLNNGEKFTFITSIGCGVAMFDANGGNCFGEEWVQLGSLSAPRGGVAFVGPTSNTHTTYNNRIDKGIYTGMFVEGMDTPGQALLRGKLYMYNVFGADYYCEYHYKVYCILGDPSLHVWKDVPLNVNVDHATTINVGTNELEYTVTFASNGQPVDNAEVCLTGDEIFETVCTDEFGKAYINIMPEDVETLTVTVRGGNVYPYQGLTEILQPQELVEPFGETLIVDMDGNNDGLINPNENGAITYTLKNWGTITSNNIEATLSSANTDLVEIVSTSPVSFGNLSPGDDNTGNPFQFFVKPACLVGDVVTLQLHVTSSGSSWDYDFSFDVHGCELACTSFIVHEVGTADVNYHFEPGEMGDLFLSVVNFGDDIAPDIMAELTSSDPYITINDGIASFGTLNINGTAVCTEDYFNVSVDASCPEDYLAICSLKLYTQNGNYPYQVIPEFQIPIAKLVPTYYTGPDAYGYHAYASNDGFYDQTPVYEWIEIDQVGTLLNIPSGESDYTQTVSLPFDFKYYGIDYSQIRISTDGWLAFGSGSQIEPVNAALPSNDDVNNMVAAFWDDLYDISFLGEGDIYYYNDIDNNRFIIEWDSITHYGLSTEFENEIFQIVLLDPASYPTATGDGEIIIQYKNVDEISSNTIGIENHTQNVGLQYVFDEAYDATAAELTNNLAIKFTTEEPYVSILTSVDENEGIGDDAYNLSQNQPNPFSSETWINYTLPDRSNVTLSVYNVNGELVRMLQSGEQAAGKYSVKWDAINNAGNSVKSGIYFYRLQTENFVETKKMFMIK